MDHVRIDEGVKRGRRRKDAPYRPKKRNYPALADSQSKAAQHRATILQALTSGRMLKDIADDLQVSPSALSHYLAQDPEYIAAREAGIAVQLDDWQKAMEVATSPLNLARAREVFRAVAWRGEREFPHRWAQRSHVTVEHVGDLAERLRRARERVIDAEPQDAQVIESNAAALPQPGNDSSVIP